MGDFLDQFERIPTPQKVLILVLLIAAIGLAFYFIIYNDQAQSIDRAQAQVSELNARQASLRAEIDDIDRIREDVRMLCQRQQAFMEKLPSSPGISSLLRSIEQQAQLTGLSIVRNTRGADVRTPNYTTIPLSLELEGTYDQLADFFYFLGRQPRIVNISNINLSPTTGGSAGTTGSAPVLRASCELATYFAAEDQVQGVEACEG